MNRRRAVIALVGLALLASCLSSCEKEAEPAGHPQASARGAAAREKPYQASVLRDPFHEKDCRWAKKINTENLVGYDSRQGPIDDGHRPCKVCQP